MDELKKAVLEILKVYLPEDSENPILNTLIDRAIHSYMAYVNYPPDVSDDDKVSDMKDNLYCILDLALYSFNKQGADFESNHNENGVNMTFDSEGSIYTRHGVVPYART